jgi:predicted DNA-binding ribbon-helix-helix protein
MIAKSEHSRSRIDGQVTRCIAFERRALEDLQELAWASNLPLEDLVREAVDRYRHEPAART